MSTFSSLILFYPSVPPTMNLHQARRFCDQLRAALDLRDAFLTVEVKYGASIDQDDESTNQIDWDETEIIVRFVSYDWDHEKRGASWSELWPAPAFDSRNLYRAYVGLGKLPKQVSVELTAMRDEQTTDAFITPDSFSFQIDPICPATLDTEELVGYGYIELAFSGNGFFSWQPLSRYWEQIRASPALSKVRQICREHFPVPEPGSVHRLKSALGELFLNRDSYQSGDWIVSVSETG